MDSCMKKLIFISFCLIACLMFGNNVSAQSSIILEKGTKNPDLIFRGVNGNPELSKAVQNALSKCGWFNVISSGNASYIVSGKAIGNSLTLDVTNSAGALDCTVTKSGTDPRKTAFAAVDEILKKLFKIEGICRTRILFAAETVKGQKEIYMCDFDGANFVRLTQNGTLSIDPKWNPNGKTFVYSYFGPSYTNLVEHDLATQQVRRLSKFPGINAGGRISPDGRHVALILAHDNQVDLYVRATNGSQLTRLTKDKAVEASPCWSPDGRKVCYVSDKGGRPALYVVEPFSGSPKAIRLTGGNGGSELVSPSWSKDNKIAYSSKIGPSYTVAVMDMNAGPLGTDVKVGPIGSSPIAGQGPSWAPDNRHVVVADRGSVYVVDTVYGKVRKLVDGTSKVFSPDWSPILY